MTKLVNNGDNAGWGSEGRVAAEPNSAIPFFRYSALYCEHEDEVAPVILDVLRRGAFILQEELRKFEAHFAAFVGARGSVGVGNCTDAMTLALLATGVGAGDEVVLPAHTFVATAGAVHIVGATPVLVDCGPDHLVDPQAVEAAVTPRTRCIVPVHLNGRVCDMPAINTIAQRAGAIVVEDAAQALGARLGGRCAGTFGVAGAFSFYPAKLLGGFGDGGALVSDDPTVIKVVSRMRDHGRDASGDVRHWSTLR